MSKCRVWCPEYGQTEDDAREIATDDAEQAARKWAQWYDKHSAEFNIVGGSDVVAHVRAPDGELLCFRVYGEAVPYYSAYVEPGAQEGA